MYSKSAARHRIPLFEGKGHSLSIDKRLERRRRFANGALSRDRRWPGSADRGQRWLAGEDGGRVVQGEDAHGVAGGFAGAGGVGSEDEAGDVEQRRVDIGFTFEHVQGGAADLARREGRRSSAVSSTTPPRAVLIRYAVGFMARRAAASMRWWVPG